MNGLTPITVTSKPLSAPTPSPTSRITMSPNSGGHPACNARAPTTPATATVEPTERSIPLATITQVMANAMIEITAVCNPILRKLLTVMKSGRARPNTNPIRQVVASRMNCLVA
jgi:hypothetical protein